MSRPRPILSTPIILATLAAAVLLPAPPVQAATPADLIGTRKDS